MSQPAVKWGAVRRFFLHRGYQIRYSGGDAMIVEPKTGNKASSRRTVRIGHRYSNHKGSELLPAHLAAIERAFGVTREQILER